MLQFLLLQSNESAVTYVPEFDFISFIVFYAHNNIWKN